REPNQPTWVLRDRGGNNDAIHEPRIESRGALPHNPRQVNDGGVLQLSEHFRDLVGGLPLSHRLSTQEVGEALKANLHLTTAETGFYCRSHCSPPNDWARNRCQDGEHPSLLT